MGCQAFGVLRLPTVVAVFACLLLAPCRADRLLLQFPSQVPYLPVLRFRFSVPFGNERRVLSPVGSRVAPSALMFRDKYLAEEEKRKFGRSVDAL